MNKFFPCLLAIWFFSHQASYYGSTTAPVVLSGAIIKSKHLADGETKYKRKDCPVCKGQGWYLSGDKIKKIECLYCEP